MILFFLPNGIGDTLMAVPALRRLVAARGVDKVAVVVSSALHSRLLRDFVDPLLRTIDRYDGRPIPHLRLFYRMWTSGAAWVSAPMVSRRWQHYLFFLLLPRRTQVPRSFIQRSHGGLLRSPLSLETFDGHQVNYFVQFLAEIDPGIDRGPVDPTELAPRPGAPGPGERPGPASDNAKASRRRRVAVGISCGELERHKVPSPAFFARLLNALSRRLNIELLILGTASDLPLIAEFRSELDADIVVELAIGQPIDELILQLSRCDLGVSGTTGQGHMMAAAGLPMLVTAGVTNPQESGPYVRRAAILRHRYLCGPCYQETFRLGCGRIQCMETLDIDEGATLALRLLQEGDYGARWLSAPKIPPVAVPEIVKLHSRPLAAWTQPREVTE